MKIYRMIKLNSKGKTIAEDSYEYNGSVSLCKGPKIPPPPPPPEPIQFEPPRLTDSEIDAARVKARAYQVRRKGSIASLLTGGRGVVQAEAPLKRGGILQMDASLLNRKDKLSGG